MTLYCAYTTISSYFHLTHTHTHYLCVARRTPDDANCRGLFLLWSYFREKNDLMAPNFALYVSDHSGNITTELATVSCCYYRTLQSRFPVMVSSVGDQVSKSARRLSTSLGSTVHIL